MPFRSLLYVSRRHPRFDEAELLALTERASQRNAQVGVTGALISSPRHFAQLLEGTTTAVELTFARIAADQRHSNISVLNDARVSQHTFPDWAMAYAGHSPSIDELVQNAVDLPRWHPARKELISEIRSLFLRLRDDPLRAAWHA